MSNAVVNPYPREHSAPTVYAAARLDGAAPPKLTAGMVVKASAILVPILLLQPRSVVVNPYPREPSAPTVYAVARLDGAAPPKLTAGMVAKASALPLPLLLLPLPLLLLPLLLVLPLLVPLLLVPAGIFLASFQEISSIKCLST